MIKLIYFLFFLLYYSDIKTKKREREKKRINKFNLYIIQSKLDS